MKIHHLGKVVRSIAEELQKYERLGFDAEKDILVDQEQKVRVGKVKSESCMIELLEPLDESSPIWNFSQNQAGFHHICIEVPDIEAYIAAVKARGLGFRLTGKTRSVFDGRTVCFIATKEKDIIELIEPLSI
ncbi:MAG: VOC family protein [Candidatus Wildermuthbacteria bacterium]|nr:VOC family protein [Candidatus Wildermuthbacteria bacterium]